MSFEDVLTPKQLRMTEKDEKSEDLSTPDMEIRQQIA